MAVIVEPITVDDTLDLRSRVLREGRPHEGFPDDGAPTTLHLGARVNGELAGVATFSPGADGVWQLRAMAVDDRLQRRGIGRALLDEGVERLRALDARLVWANGRDTALDFYEGVGWRTVGDGYVLGPLALPHHRVERDLRG